MVFVAARAIPKSVTFADISGVISMFCGDITMDYFVFMRVFQCETYLGKRRRNVII